MQSERVAPGSGGLFIAKVLYQTPGSSFLSCCSCLVGCRYKLGCGRCRELPRGSFPDDYSHREGRMKYQLHRAPFFLITRRQLVKAASWARVVHFPSFVCVCVRRCCCCSLSCLSCIARGYLITTLKESDGLHNSSFNLFESLANDCLWDRFPSSFPSLLLEIYYSSSLSVQQREQINLQSRWPV